MKKIVLSVLGLFLSASVLAGGYDHGAYGAVTATSASMGGAQSGAMAVGNGFVVSGAQNMTSNQSGAFVDVSRGRDGAQVETGTFTVSASKTMVGVQRYGYGNGMAGASGVSEGSAFASGATSFGGGHMGRD